MENPSLRYLKELSKGNRNLESKIFNLMLEELFQECSTYQKAVVTKNFYWASEIVRNIKHKIVFFEMWEALSLAEKHEEALLSAKLKHHKEFLEFINSLLKLLPER